MKLLTVFAHGKESGPWGSKIRHLADIAQRMGSEVISPDYGDLQSGDARVARLLGLSLPVHDSLVLVGSSMGGYVSTIASATLHPTGLFLMAPAFGLPGYTEQQPVAHARQISVVHGWQDELIRAVSSFRFAEQHRAELHLLDADHRLNSVLPTLGKLFEEFLSRCKEVA